MTQRISTPPKKYETYEGQKWVEDVRREVNLLQDADTAMDTRMDTAESDIDSLETRVTTAESDIDSLETRVTTYVDAKFGTAPNYTSFDSDGTMVANGNATTWDDLSGSALALQQTGPGVARNATENTVEFTTTSNLADYVYDNYQLRHAWKSGSTINPHIHWEQAQNNVPNFLIRYRWQINGGTKTTAWSDYKCNTPVFTYVSGTLNQICRGAGISAPVGYGISDVIEMRIFRDNANTSTVFAGADPYTVTVGIVFIDIHLEHDTLGSRTEYSK